MKPVTQIVLANYRCFGRKQIARLAPLTLLVGENSTGKTSFLAMIRALWDAVYRERIPDFKEEPYDLGSYDEIGHHPSTGDAPVESFETGLSDANAFRAMVTFGKNGMVPVPVRTRRSYKDNWYEVRVADNRHIVIQVGVGGESWEKRLPQDVSETLIHTLEAEKIWPLIYPRLLLSFGGEEDQYGFEPLDGSTAFKEEVLKSVYEFMNFSISGRYQRPYASAPVRSKPRRTYDPARITPDPEGDYVPMYLADMFSRNKETWVFLKDQLECFGKASGLFDEISIKRFGETGGGPFQVQIIKVGGESPQQRRNLIDVGYGVSQVLPVVTELLRQDAPQMFLLQQPEVHLHPSAQAALGSLFCQVAGKGRQLVIETHSDFIIDRVRMDIRDSKSKLKPDDVSILYFEREELGVRIHSIRLDELGNVKDAPDSYRRFFAQELDRSLGL